MEKHKTGKTGTINVVREDKALDISRAIIKTHKYCLLNFDLLTDRERGYMFNEYFPAVKHYLTEPILEPLAEELVFTGVSVSKNYPRPGEWPLVEKEPFAFNKAARPAGVMLSQLPAHVMEVYLAKDAEDKTNTARWVLAAEKEWVVNLSTGQIDFVADINTQEIMDYIGADKSFVVFVEYRTISSTPRATTPTDNRKDGAH